MKQEKLELVVLSRVSLPPDAPHIMTQVISAASRVATTWTEPQYVGTSDGSAMGLDLPDDLHVKHYLCRAQRRAEPATADH